MARFIKDAIRGCVLIDPADKKKSAQGGDMFDRQNDADELSSDVENAA